MNLELFSIRDRKALTYNVPFTALNPDVAIRDFAGMVNDKNSIINRNPEDFSLHAIGVFNTDTGLVESFGETMLVVTAIELLPKE